MSRSSAGKVRGTGRTTLEEVAALAGVSTMTASRTLSQPQLVSEATRTRVHEAVSRLGYVPNRAARALASSQSRVIAVLVPSLSNAVFSAVLDGIHDAIEASQYQVLIGNTHYSDAEEEKLLNIYMQSHPDGILLSGLTHSAAVERMLSGSRVPIVSMMDLADDSAQMSVGFSQYEAGFAMTRHLLERGYRRVAFIGAQLDERTLRRADGYRDALRAAGLYDPQLEVMVSDRSTIELGADLMRETMGRIPDCDAVFCCNDDLAYGAIYYCQRQGIRIPQQVAVGGFNDLQASAWMVPALTTIETPRYRVGYEAATLLLQAIEGRAPVQRRIDLGFTLRAREST